MRPIFLTLSSSPCNLSCSASKLVLLHRTEDCLFPELVVNPRTFFGFCCKDWGTRGDLRFVPVTHIQVSNPRNQIELPGRKLAVDPSSVTVVIVSPGHPQSQTKEEDHQEYPIL
ncbi:hypothetical protein JHK87_055816 [Glycine soja]|nr:hypothetical protein JHK87_055816 [Glycine soja]